jgi:hypothetical protein
MRRMVLTLVAGGLIALSGCGCFEHLTEDSHLTRYGGGPPDPEQSAWDRFINGTRYLPPYRICSPSRASFLVDRAPSNQTAVDSGGLQECDLSR